MPDKAYKLRSELADSFVGGSVISGFDRGTVDLKEALEQGDGVIMTANPHLQGILDNYYGTVDGKLMLVFDAFSVDSQTGEQTKIDPPVVGATAKAPRPDLIEPPLIKVQPSDPNDPSSPVHQHDGYAGLKLSELEDIATERGLEYPAGASDEDIIAILEAHDEKGS